MQISSLAGTIAPANTQGVQKSAARLQSVIQSLVGSSLNPPGDIATLTSGAQLQAQATILRQAFTNVSHASSLLQVAGDGSGQIEDALKRMQQLAAQATDGKLSENDRNALDKEFQDLRASIDQHAANTRFGGASLLDGSLSDEGRVQTVTTPATRATGSIGFNANVGAGQTININGATLKEGADFHAGPTLQATLDSLKTALNASTDPKLSQATFSRAGNALVITSDLAGEAGNQFTVNKGASTASASFTVNGSQIGSSGIFSLAGGKNDGLGAHSVHAGGTSGEPLVRAEDVKPAQAEATFSNASDIQNGNTLQVSDGTGGFVTFTFKAGASTGKTDIQLGATLEDTLQNAAATIRNFAGNNDFGTRQLEVNTSGNQLVFTAKNGGNATDAQGNAVQLKLNTTGGSLSRDKLDNASASGVDASGLANADFKGKIEGFSAVHNAQDSVTAQVTVGGKTYSADIANTNDAADRTVRFSSANGGFFDVQLAGGKGAAVNDQAGANAFSERLNKAFSGLTFSQAREVGNFNPIGSLSGGRLTVQGSHFSGLSVGGISASPAIGGNAQIAITLNGETYRSQPGLGSSIGAGESVTLTGTSGNKLVFTNGNNAVQLRTESDANNFSNDLKDAFGSGQSGVAFQVGNSGNDLAQVSISSLSSGSLLGAPPLDLLSQGNAQAALGTVNASLTRVSDALKDINALQQSLNFATANLESAIFNQEAARSTLDPFAANELSLATFQQNIAQAVAAQGNRLSPALLQLIA
jgi:flagellin